MAFLQVCFSSLSHFIVAVVLMRRGTPPEEDCVGSRKYYALRIEQARVSGGFWAGAGYHSLAHHTSGIE